MATGDEYRARARDLFEMAKRESNPDMRAQLERIALAFVDLAEQADQKTGSGSGVIA